MGDDTRKWEDEFIKAAKRRNKEEAERARIINDPEGYANEETPVDKRIAKRRKIRIERNEMKKRMKKVAALALLSAGAILSWFGKSSYEKLKGEEYILEKFNSSDDNRIEISVVDLSNGLSVAMTDKDTGETKYVSLEEAVNNTVESAIKQGLSAEEINIILADLYSDNVAKEMGPDVTEKGVNRAKQEAYYKSQLAKSKGATR